MKMRITILISICFMLIGLIPVFADEPVSAAELYAMEPGAVIAGDYVTDEGLSYLYVENARIGNFLMILEDDPLIMTFYKELHNKSLFVAPGEEVSEEWLQEEKDKLLLNLQLDGHSYDEALQMVDSIDTHKIFSFETDVKIRDTEGMLIAFPAGTNFMRFETYFRTQSSGWTYFFTMDYEPGIIYSFTTTSPDLGRLKGDSAFSDIVDKQFAHSGHLYMHRIAPDGDERITQITTFGHTDDPFKLNQ